MTAGPSSHDRVDYPRHQLGDRETQGIREADARRTEEDDCRSELEEYTYSKKNVGSSSVPASRQDLDALTPTSHHRTRSSTNEAFATSADEARRDEFEANKRYSLTESQGHLSPNNSGSATSSSLESPASATFPRSPLSSASTVAADPSKPSVRFTDRGPPRGIVKRPTVSRQSSSNGAPVREWGVLFDEAGYATARSGQFLRGVARYIIEDFAPESSNLVVTPEKLVLLYSRYGLDSELYPFLEIFNSRAKDFYDRLADFFSDLDCQYHLIQPDAYSRPRVPALTPTGFAQYFTLCILAHPDEEFRRLDWIVCDAQIMADVPSANNEGQLFEKLPRQLIRSQFPVRHDPKSRKILEAALEDLAYDLGLLETSRPKSPLAIMPPPPPPASGAASSERAPRIQRFVRKGGHVVPLIDDDDHDRDSYRERSRYEDSGDESDRTLASPRASKAGPLNSTLKTSTASLSNTVNRPYPTTTSGGTAIYPHTLANTSTKTYRRAQSPPVIRGYRASAPDVSSNTSPTSYHRSTGYAPVERERRNAIVDTSPTHNHGSGSRTELGPPTPTTPTSSTIRSSSGAALSKAPTPNTTTMTLVSSTTSLPSATNTEHHRRDSHSHSRQDSFGSTRRAIVAMNTGEKKHHSHGHTHTHTRSNSHSSSHSHKDRGPTWEEVLKSQPSSPHHHSSHHRTGSSSSGHHYRHRSGH
ncbi:uncharacterized protein F4822DRAFT_429345 [Hypoxylon trugodes]|uniref:uncharacterized protein n=1 Tax=Hypoxylon trugodes TaxID=326681 RepID=UPI0021A0B7C6|nr:uncharacterized protein F4822DRAFT_429345 [Hypoxylon trugodes]KAI1388729.1 hypothetical protein F4822DRAFT_429345 [Hypoxylon trugodes]